MRIRCESRWGAHTQMCSWTQIQVEQTRRVGDTSALTLTQWWIEWKRDGTKKKKEREREKKQCQVKVSEVDASNRCLIFYRANDKKWEEIVFICFLTVCCFCTAQLIFQKEQIYGFHTHTLTLSLCLIRRESSTRVPNYMFNFIDRIHGRMRTILSPRIRTNACTRPFFFPFSQQQHKWQNHGRAW